MTDRPHSSYTPARTFGLPIALGISLVLVWLLGDGATDLLMYQRTDIEAGQVWRLLTAHWVHLSTQHLFLNLSTLAIIWWLFGDSLAGRTGYFLTGLTALGLTLSLFLLHPGVWWYAGFSGVLHGLLIAGALISRHDAPLFSLLVMLIVAIKLALELVLGASSTMTKFIDSPILVEAHLYGAVLGALGVFLIGAKNTVSKRI
ncbi:MAG: rhomboid family GlyGly-CTERM serine protease [Pseudomonadales bacterium]|jgi:rhomboid family GlyGly-CTERM serine protease